MIALLIFSITYFVAAVVYFALIQRPLFCLLNRRSNEKGGFRKGDLKNIFLYGLRTTIAGDDPERREIGLVTAQHLYTYLSKI